MATASPSSKTAQAGNPPAGKEKFLVIPIIILILAQMGATGDNGALSLSATALTQELHATTSEIQLANMVYPLVGGAFMIAGGLMGTIIGWKRTFRIGILLCAIGEIALAFAPNMTMFIWVGRVLVGFGASFMIPSVLGLIPLLYRGSNRMVAFGCIGAASGLSALLPLALPERDASQSGGIQSTMRNVGQAIGVALLGAILLLGITNAVRANAADDPSISPQVSKEVSALTIDLGSNEVFEEQISGIPMTDDERSQLVDIEENARYNSVRIAYVAGAAIVLLGLATTPAIKITSSDQRKPGKERKEGKGN